MGDALSRVPIWERIGIGVVAVLILALVGIVGLSPSTPSQVVTGATLPTVIVSPIATSTTTSVAGYASPQTTQTTGPPTVALVAPGDIGSSGGVTPAAHPATCADPEGCGHTGAVIVDRGLRTAQPAELAAIAAAVPAPPGQQIDSVMIPVAEPTWGVLHVAAAAGAAQEYVLIELIKGTWTPIDSGYPRLPCNQTIPSAVLVDLGSTATLCP